MKKCTALLFLLVATVCFAKTREWKSAKVIDVSASDVPKALGGVTHIMHYTIETADVTYLLDYPCKNGNNSEPGVTVRAITKIAIDGSHAYILDKAGKELKMHIVKQTKKKPDPEN